MGLYRANLIKLDLSQEEEDVTRHYRVQDYIKGQQHYKYPCLPEKALPPKNNDTTSGISLADDVSQSSSRWGNHCQQTSTRSIVASLSPETTLSKEQATPRKRPFTNVIMKRTAHHSTNKHIVRRQIQQQSKRNLTRQGEQRKRQVKPGLGLLDKFTSPNIEMDHITLRQNGQARPRMGLFNKGKSSARGKVDANLSKYVSDLVFSEASFLRRPVTTPANNPLKVTTHTTHRTPTKQLSSSKRSLSKVISDSHSGKSIGKFFELPPRLSTTPKIPIKVAPRTTKCQSSDQTVSEVAQEPSMIPIIVEPRYGHHQYAVPVETMASSDNTQLHRDPERQIPYYTRGITPNAPRLDTIAHGKPSETSPLDTISGRFTSSSSTPVTNFQQPDYHSHRHQERRSDAYHANTQIKRLTSSPKTPPVSLFATLGGLKPFFPTKKKKYHHHHHSVTPSSTDSTSPGRAPLRIPSEKPIYPVFQPQPRKIHPFDETRYHSSIDLSDSEADELNSTANNTTRNLSPFLYQPNPMYTGRSPQQQRQYSPQPIYKAQQYPRRSHQLAFMHLYHDSQTPDGEATSSPSLSSYF